MNIDKLKNLSAATQALKQLSEQERALQASAVASLSATPLLESLRSVQESVLPLSAQLSASLGFTESLRQAAEQIQRQYAIHEQVARSISQWGDLSASVHLAAEQLFRPLALQADAARMAQRFSESLTVAARLSEQHTRFGIAEQYIKSDLAATTHLRQLIESMAAFDSTAFSRMQSALQSASRTAEVAAAVDESELPTRSSASAVLEQATTAAESQGAAHPFLSEAFWNALPWQIRIVILAILLPLWQYVFTAALDGIVSRFSRASTTEERQQIVVYVHEQFGPDVASQLRTVSASSLRVRSAPRKDAPIVAHLSRGVLVKVIETEASWTLVHYAVGESDELHSGWVASGHLRKLTTDSQR